MFDSYKKNQQLKEQLYYLRSGEYYNQLRFEINMLEHIVDNMEISKEDREFIDMTHRNTELLSNWNELKEWLKEEIKYDENWYNPECEEYIGPKKYPDDTIDGFKYSLNKMQEIEKGNENDK